MDDQEVLVAMKFFACIAIIIASSAVQAEAIGDWKVVDATPYLVAFTKNKSSSEFGIICKKNNDCTFFIAFKTGCTPGDSVTYLINSDSHSANAISESSKCIKDSDGKSVMKIETPGNEFKKIIHSSKLLSIAIPLKSGRFEVMHFSLIGAKQAIEAAIQRSFNQRTTDKNVVM